MKSKYLLITLLGAALLLACACNLSRINVGPVQIDTESVELGAADSVDVEIDMGAGELAIQGGASSLVDATFTYNVEEWKPEVDYQVSGERGELTVKQPSDPDVGIPDDDIRYEWELTFNNSVPLAMIVNLGAGESNLELADLQLSSLELQGGAGKIEVDLSGSTLRDLTVNMGAGETALDLSGNWAQDLSAAITGGVGKVTLILPSSVGVRIRAQGGLGGINAPGFSKNGDIYTNDAYGESEITLDIEVTSGVGEINLELAE